MIYQIKYGSSYLRRGGLGPIGTIYMHPCQVRAAITGFEKRHPAQAGKAQIQCVSKRRVVKVVSSV